PKLAAAVLLIVASAAYLVVMLRQRGHLAAGGTIKTAGTVSAPGGVQPQQPLQSPSTTQASLADQTAIGPPSSQLTPGTKLVVKVVDPFSLPPSAQKKTAEAQKPPQTFASTTKASSIPSMPLPPAFVPEAMRSLTASAGSAQVQERPAGAGPSPSESAGTAAVPPSVACTIEGDEKVAILRTSAGRSVVVRTGDKVEGFRVTSIRTGEVVFRGSDGSTRVITVGAKANGS
ncbi:MAG: hypothetical protein ACUVRO_07910, partial [Armatimonadota bacterium]